MMPSSPSDKFCVPFSDKYHVPRLIVSSASQPLSYPGLEATEYEHQQYPYHGLNSGIPSGHETTPIRKDYSSTKQPRVLGLSPMTFWVVMIVLVVMLAGGIGGGLAGGLAASNRSSTSEVTVATTSRPGPTGSDTMSNAAEATATATTTDPSSSTTVPSNLRVGTLATDGGCPGINGTIYTPREGDGKPYANANFLKLCSTDFSDVVLSYRLHDILRVRVETLDQCIQICAEYNLSYHVAIAEGVPPPGNSVCRAVSLKKKPGDYCFLKNDTGPNTATGEPDPSVYTSAVLLA
ncbi:hypothetical protein QBC36DRAFT_306513 [Triangularia setosa]|uniref:Uncharacterized protein n=1 Tax=Triangularia setosa TaxID=2587417 RepID=A0AAN7AAF8_9PEZI|nr:hypothetical protein QBC36DRAFT_306513 [Podospora setosa]